ncbi:hypothetical protein C9I98_25505 [Photobacterium sanctipauli]|uniref:Uncharacterized protein n=1 Tax=Photobacterium sanctipauli TaxID=1342794 RepID=A0A2T3N977_9GAMM|nr:hypothetical protein [Photobacterium sanctipauli]PSW09984.1 hypothetical protein C9I98_25505 [Photobacterium sanctipauli]
MPSQPKCCKCGQDEEFLVSGDNRYLCICGHQFTVSAQGSSENNHVQAPNKEEDGHYVYDAASLTLH